MRDKVWDYIKEVINNIEKWKDTIYGEEEF